MVKNLEKGKIIRLMKTKIQVGWKNFSSKNQLDLQALADKSIFEPDRTKTNLAWKDNPKLNQAYKES